MENITWDGLAVYVADDDFIEYLHEMGYETIEEVELYEEWDAWSAENVEKVFRKCGCFCNSCLLGQCCQDNVVHLPSSDYYGTYTTITYGSSD